MWETRVDNNCFFRFDILIFWCFMSFNRKIDKSKIPTINIMGVYIAAINMSWLTDFVRKNINDLKGDYICVSNVHTTVMASENSDYRQVQNGGILAIPDGGPLSTVGRYRGAIHMERTTGPSFLEEILKEGRYRHFFYGSTEDTLKKLSDNIKALYPDTQITGMYSPPFRILSADEDKEIVEMINKSDPDFVWVGLGAPKQENWMASHQGKINGLMVGVGAAFDYFAGNIKRAPVWMQKYNLEWLYRLLQDPKRLFKRYFVTNTKFICKLFLNR